MQPSEFITIPLKRCSKCKSEKTLDSFCVATREKDGRQGTCRACMFEYHRRSYAYKNLPKVDMPGGLRRCSSCKEIKPIGQYYKSDKSDLSRYVKAGSYRTCIQCVAGKVKERAERLKVVPSVISDTKYCNGCQHRKQQGEFTTNKAYKDWLSPICIPCEQKARDRKLGLGEYLRSRNLRVKYGMTPEGFRELLSKQSGACAICHKQLEAESIKKGQKTSHRAVVDHCHATGRVRGILCPSCNMGIAKLERLEWVAAANKYLAGGWE